MDADRIAWLKDVRAGFEANGIGWAMWEYNKGFGLLKGAVVDMATENVMESVPPVANITSPANNAGFSVFPTISGTASDVAPGSLSRVELVIGRGSDGKEWDGSTWVTAPGGGIATTLSGGTWSVSSNFPSGANLTADVYALTAEAYDNGGNVGVDDDTSLIIYTANTPVNVSALHPESPWNGSNVAQTAWNEPHTVSSTYFDPNGASDINLAHQIVNNGPSRAGSITGIYYQNKLWLSSDDGTLLLGGYTPGSANSISNTYGWLDCAKTTVAATGNLLEVAWRFTPKSTMSASPYKKLYPLVADVAGHSDSYELKGYWTITANNSPLNTAATHPTSATDPVAGPASATSAAGTPHFIRTTFSDPDGAHNVSLIYLLINTGLAWGNSIGAKYDARDNKLYLNDGSNPPNWGTGFAPGSANTITTAYGSLNCAQSTVERNGNNLTINWRITPPSARAGNNTIYLYVTDYAGATDGWDSPGPSSWTITTGGSFAPPGGSGGSSAATDSNNVTPYNEQTATTEPDGAPVPPLITEDETFSSVQAQHLEPNFEQKTVTLTFSGELARTETTALRLEIGGKPVEIANYEVAQNQLILQLAPDVLQEDADIALFWQGLADAANRPLRDSSALLPGAPNALF